MHKIKKAKPGEELESTVKCFKDLSESGINIVKILKGSIILILEFEFLEALEYFWILYETGTFRKMLYHDYITNSFLELCEVSGVEFSVFVKKEDYEKAYARAVKGIDLKFNKNK